MSGTILKVAVIHRLFHGADGVDRLEEALGEAARAGAALALLPELPLDRWHPAERIPHDEDAEHPGGPRHTALAQAAAGAGIAVMGGAITIDADSEERRNRGLLFNASGSLIARYDKLHLPSEDGFWESDHYRPGVDLPSRVDDLGFPMGMQICSDLQRHQGTQLLAAQGAELVVGPRATPEASYERWRTVIRANAVAATCYVISVNRPHPERGVPIGGPSVVAAPDGSVLAESTDPLTLVELDRKVVATARRDYPGYLAVRADLYARGWSAIAEDLPQGG